MLLPSEEEALLIDVVISNAKKYAESKGRSTDDTAVYTYLAEWPTTQIIKEISAELRRRGYRIEQLDLRPLIAGRNKCRK